MGSYRTSNVLGQSQSTCRKCYVPWGSGLAMSGIITKTQSLQIDAFSNGHLLPKRVEKIK